MAAGLLSLRLVMNTKFRGGSAVESTRNERGSRTHRAAVAIFSTALACLCGVLISGGAATSVAAPPPASTSPFSDQVPHSREADDVARFLAGLPSRPGSPFASQEDDPIWKEHKTRIDDMWKRASDGFVGGLRNFGDGTLKQVTDADRLLFYPFGGPDALTAVLCFPGSPQYVLLGLEPAGSLPTPKQLEKKNLPQYLGALRESMASVLGKSFFVTREMDKQFRGQVTDGNLPAIAFLLVRLDYQILGLRAVRIDETGRMVPWPAEGMPGVKYPNRGVEIEIQGKGRAQRLYYFSLNLADNRYGANVGFQTFVTELGRVKTLLKSTSYMTHHPEFSIIRNEILAQTDELLQDDSGIPYKYLTTPDWKVRLFGDYEKPYGSFGYMVQPALRSAYKEHAEPLPFRIGYGFSRVPSNLLLAHHVNDAAQTAANK